MTNEQRLIPFLEKLNNKIKNKDIYIDRTGVKFAELISPRIELDPTQPILDFGVKKTNLEYAKAEIEWYDSQDLSVKNTIGKKAQMWNKIADEFGRVNSNYGYLIYSKGNYFQYNNCLKELKKNKDSRRAVMIYNRPSIWEDYNMFGMSDFICTFAVQCMIRDNKLIYIVMMRSNDLIFGAFNDIYWACIVYERLYEDLKIKYKKIKYGNLIWIANSLHVYEQHFGLIKKIVENFK